MEQHRDDQNEQKDEEKDTLTPVTLQTSRSYGSRETLLSDVCTDFLTVVYQEGIGSSLMAFQHAMVRVKVHFILKKNLPTTIQFQF